MVTLATTAQRQSCIMRTEHVSREWAEWKTERAKKRWSGSAERSERSRSGEWAESATHSPLQPDISL